MYKNAYRNELTELPWPTSELEQYR